MKIANQKILSVDKVIRDLYRYPSSEIEKAIERIGNENLPVEILDKTRTSLFVDTIPSPQGYANNFKIEDGFLKCDLYISDEDYKKIKNIELFVSPSASADLESYFATTEENYKRRYVFRDIKFKYLIINESSNEKEVNRIIYNTGLSME